MPKDGSLKYLEDVVCAKEQSPMTIKWTTRSLSGWKGYRSPGGATRCDGGESGSRAWRRMVDEANSVKLPSLDTYFGLLIGSIVTLIWMVCE